jgi:hypothetical protein
LVHSILTQQSWTVLSSSLTTLAVSEWHQWCNGHSVHALNDVDRLFNHWSGKTKGYKIGICFFSAKQAAVRCKTSWLGIKIT